MLRDVDCDVVAIGEYFARRGSAAIHALNEGKHVIVDKPLCTSLDELDEIERIAGETELKVGCMLSMRDHGQTIGARKLIREGAIGEIHAISFGGQHPLMLGKRPGWYFEEGKHGGTINDLAIHAIDCLPWITGLEFETANAARCWNAFAPEYPHFHDGAQMMLTMDNGCGVLGDVSYFMPDKAGYSLPFYWRYTFWGTGRRARSRHDAGYHPGSVEGFGTGGNATGTGRSVRRIPGGVFKGYQGRRGNRGTAHGVGDSLRQNGAQDSESGR